MKKHITAVAALAGSLLLVPVLIGQANAGHGAGGHFGGGMGGGRMGSIGGNIGHMGGVHVGGGNIGHIGSGHINGGRIGGTHIASVGGWGGSRWHSGSAWHGNNNWHGNNWHGQNWHGHNHDHFAHDHHRFNNRFVGVGVGWWPGYYGSYGYGGCAWLRQQAVITGSPYWRDRYYSCVNYY